MLSCMGNIFSFFQVSVISILNANPVNPFKIGLEDRLENSFYINGQKHVMYNYVSKDIALKQKCFFPIHV